MIAGVIGTVFYNSKDSCGILLCFLKASSISHCDYTTMKLWQLVSRKRRGHIPQWTFTTLITKANWPFHLKCIITVIFFTIIGLSGDHYSASLAWRMFRVFSITVNIFLPVQWIRKSHWNNYVFLPVLRINQGHKKVTHLNFLLIPSKTRVNNRLNTTLIFKKNKYFFDRIYSSYCSWIFVNYNLHVSLSS